MSKAVVLFSGGQDSTTCLAWAARKFGHENLYPVSFAYGQRHEVELEQAERILVLLGIRNTKIISVEALSDLAGAALTNPSIEVEVEASEESENAWAHEHGLPSTFVPGRNLIFLTLAAAYGAKFGVRTLVTGICQQDAAGYPDCRSSFKDAAQEALSEALDDDITIYAPLLNRTKAETFQLARELGVLPVVLEESHTCYHGDRSERHTWGYGCGECPACLERTKGYDEFMAMSEYA